MNSGDRDGKTDAVSYKKSLKIPKGQSESVYRRRTDNTMAKRKSTKGQTTIYKTLVVLPIVKFSKSLVGDRGQRTKIHVKMKRFIVI